MLGSKALPSLRRKLLREIKQMVTPHLRESGYRKALDPKKGILGGSRPLLLWTPLDGNGKAVVRDWDLGGLVVDTFQGFTEEGVMEEADMGLVTIYWRAVPVEDLVKLRAWLAKKLPRKEAS